MGMFLVQVEFIKKSGHRSDRTVKMWLSLFTVGLAIAICLGVAATLSAVNNPG